MNNKYICSMNETTINLNNSCRRRHSYTLTDILIEKYPEWSIHVNSELVPRHSAGIPT